MKHFFLQNCRKLIQNDSNLSGAVQTTLETVSEMMKMKQLKVIMIAMNIAFMIMISFAMTIEMLML